MTIKRNQIEEGEPLVLSDLFGLPEGLVSGVKVEPFVIDRDEIFLEDELDDAEKLPPPNNIQVKFQLVTEAADKSHRVHVVLSFDDVEGAASYEAKVTPS